MTRDNDDDRAPDFSVVRANARLELHEAVCAERYNGILAGQQMMAAQIASMQAAFDARLDTMSNRMWGGVISVCLAAIGGLAVVVFHLLTKK